MPLPQTINVRMSEMVNSAIQAEFVPLYAALALLSIYLICRIIFRIVRRKNRTNVVGDVKTVEDAKKLLDGKRH